MRPAYLAWLLAVHTEGVSDDAIEPPVPAGLAKLTAAQEAMVEFLRIDIDLIAAAARGSAAPTDEAAPFHRWLMGLSTRDFDVSRFRRLPELAIARHLYGAKPVRP